MSSLTSGLSSLSVSIVHFSGADLGSSRSEKWFQILFFTSSPYSSLSKGTTESFYIIQWRMVGYKVNKEGNVSHDQVSEQEDNADGPLSSIPND